MLKEAQIARPNVLIKYTAKLRKRQLPSGEFSINSGSPGPRSDRIHAEKGLSLFVDRVFVDPAGSCRQPESSRPHPLPTTLDPAGRRHPDGTSTGLPSLPLARHGRRSGPARQAPGTRHLHRHRAIHRARPHQIDILQPVFVGHTRLCRVIHKLVPAAHSLPIPQKHAKGNGVHQELDVAAQSHLSRHACRVTQPRDTPTGDAITATKPPSPLSFQAFP